MATVTIRKSVHLSGAPIRRNGHVKAYLQDETGRRFVFPFAPVVTDHEGDTPTFVRLARPGRRPLIRRAGGHSRTLVFSAVIAKADPQASVEPQIQEIRRIGRHGNRVLAVSIGQLAGGWWRVESLRVTTEARQHGTNRATRATVTVSMVEDYNVRPKIGRTAVRPPAPKPKPRPPAPTTRVHVVKKGDTLWELSRKYLGDPYRWKEIARRNGVKDPRRLQIGHRLTIPPR